MQEITQADVKKFLDQYNLDNIITDELKDVFDVFEKTKDKSNFFKLMEDYLEEFNKTLFSEDVLTKDKGNYYDCEYIVEFNKEESFTSGLNCDNKFSFFSTHLNIVDENYEFLGLDADIIANCVNNKISLFSDLFTKYSELLNLNIKLSPILNTSEEECHILGRIYTDNEVTINESNIILEGSKHINANDNKAQLLNLINIKNLLFFPGQIIAIKGKKEIDQFSIKYFVSNIYAGLPVHANIKLNDQFLMKFFNKKEIEKDIQIENMFKENENLNITKIKKMYNNHNIHIMICNGYIYAQDEYTDNLNNFLKLVNDKCPHVVIILGPFLYISNFLQKIQNFGDLNVIYNHIFKKIMITAQYEHLSKTEFYIIPSVYDLINVYPIPQPPFNFNENIPDNLHFLSNPSYIYINEFKIALTSCDIIQNIDMNIFSKPPERKYFYLFEQILRQISFFPSYPSDIPLDPTKFNYLLFNPNKLPDIYIFPSWLNEQPYVKENHKKIFICPISIDIKNAKPNNIYTNIYILPHDENKTLSQRIIMEKITFKKK